MNKKESREAFRMPFTADVICRMDSGDTCYGTLRNISSVSLFFETSNQPPSGTNCELEIIMNGNFSRLRIDKLEGCVMRNAEDGVAIRLYENFEWVALIPPCSTKMRDSS